MKTIIPLKNLKFDSALLHCTFLMTLAYVLYSQTFFNDWSLDDYKVIVNNIDVKSLAGFFDDNKPGRPLREFSFLIDYKIFGLEPFGYHFQHLFWHGLNGVLIYFIGRRLFANSYLALFSATLFLIHPITVEVVANLSHRKDSLSLAFSLLSLISFGYAHRNKNAKRWALFVLSVVLYAIALTAKMNALLVPLLWLAYEYRFVANDKRLLGKISQLKSIFVVLAVGSLAYVWKVVSIGGLNELQYHAWKTISRMEIYPKPELIDYLELLFKSWGKMLIRVVWPFNLAPEYSVPAPTSFFDLELMVGFLAIIFALILLFKLSVKSQSNTFFAIVWCFVFWLPISNIWPIASLAADRYWYAILPGITFLFIQALRYLWDRYPVATTVPLVCICLVFYGLSFQQSKLWKSNAILWEHALKVNPGSSAANHNMGVTHYFNGNPELAIVYLKRSTELYPYKTIAYYNLSQIYKQLGRYKEELEARSKMNLKPPWERRR